MKQCAVVSFVLACSACGSDSVPSDAPPVMGAGGAANTVPAAVGADGAVLSLGGAMLEIPAGALSDEVWLAVSPLDNELGLPPITLPGATNAVMLSSKVFAFTPHGTSFKEPVRVTLPYTEPGDTVVRLEDDSASTWEPIYAVLSDGEARFETTSFSYYAVVHLDPTLPPVEPPPVVGERIEGEHLVEIYDGGSRSYGTQRVVFDGTHLFWTRDSDGKLAVLSADLTGPLPAQAQLLFEAPWTALSGWSDPPLLATSDHLVFPVMGTIDLGGGPVANDGWASVGKDGSNFRPKLWDQWWIVARGERALVRSQEVYGDGTGCVFCPTLEFLVSPADGSSSATQMPILGMNDYNASCVYDPGADEVGCLSWGTVSSLRFSDSTYRVVSASPEIMQEQSGSIRITFNESHWFAPVELPSGRGIGAYERRGSGATMYEQVHALGAIATDDAYMYACLAGVLTRISLSDQSRQVLTQDCGDSFGVSIVGSDATYVYYVQARDGFPSLRHTGTLQIGRAAKTAAQ